MTSPHPCKTGGGFVRCVFGCETPLLPLSNSRVTQEEKRYPGLGVRPSLGRSELPLVHTRAGE